MSLEGFGDDTVFRRANSSFEIVKAVDKDLVFRTSSYHAGIILKNIQKYKRHGSILCVLSSDGYAIVDLSNNTCKVFYNDESLTYIENALKYPGVYRISGMEELSDYETEIINEIKE